MAGLQNISSPSDSSSSSPSSTCFVPSNLHLPPFSSSSSSSSSFPTVGPIMCTSPELQWYYYNYPCYYFYPFQNWSSAIIYLNPPTATAEAFSAPVAVLGYGDSPIVTPPVVFLHSHHHLPPPPPQPPLPPSGSWKPWRNKNNHGCQHNNNNAAKLTLLINNKGKGRSQHATTANTRGSQLQTPPPPPSSSPHLPNCTTVMIKNIPNTLRRRELINMLDHHCRQQNKNSKAAAKPFPFDQYDFLYLPFDFVHKQNLGYAFVNFTTVEGAVTLHNCWTGRGWQSWHNCSKCVQITPAKLQGLERCKKHFEVSIFHCRSEEYLPVEFLPPRDGFNGRVCKTMIVGTLAYPCNAVIAAPKPKPANAAAPKPKPANAAAPKPKPANAALPKPKPVIAAPPKPSCFKH